MFIRFLIIAHRPFQVVVQVWFCFSCQFGCQPSYHGLYCELSFSWCQLIAQANDSLHGASVSHGASCGGSRGRLLAGWNAFGVSAALLLRCTFLFWIEHCGIWNRCILGFVNEVNWEIIYHWWFVSRSSLVRPPPWVAGPLLSRHVRPGITAPSVCCMSKKYNPEVKPPSKVRMGIIKKYMGWLERMENKLGKKWPKAYKIYMLFKIGKIFANESRTTFCLKLIVA